MENDSYAEGLAVGLVFHQLAFAGKFDESAFSVVFFSFVSITGW